MEEDLKNAMRIIDKYSDKIPEGDYLELCNSMRDAYNQHEMQQTQNYVARSIFPENLHINDVRVDDEESLVYFYEVFEERMRKIDVTLKRQEMRSITRIVHGLPPLRRRTNKITEEVIRHFCNIHNVEIPEYTAECFEEFIAPKDQLDKLCFDYMNTENKFREMLIRDLNTRHGELGLDIDVINGGVIEF
jgi:hypothetical protein